MRFAPVVAVLIAVAAAAPIQQGQAGNSYGTYTVYTPYQGYTPYPAAVDAEAGKMQQRGTLWWFWRMTCFLTQALTLLQRPCPRRA